MSQLLSLALEFVGLLLAAIEVLFPARADRIEAVLVDLGRMRFPPRAGDVRRVLTWRLFIGVEVATIAAIWAYLLVGPGLEQVSFLREAHPGMGGWLVLGKVLGLLLGIFAALFAPVIIPILVLRVFARALRRIDRVWPGRALGGFGLVVALLGFLLSAYQMLMF